MNYAIPPFLGFDTISFAFGMIFGCLLFGLCYGIVRLIKDHKNKKLTK
jgi:uncharacterized membrane protein YciS (DUF1049 family)